MNQLKAGAVLNYVIIVTNALVGLLYTPFMLRCLGQNEYGLYSLVASIIAYLTLLDFGFGPAVVRYTAKFRAEGKKNELYSLYGLFLILYSIIGFIAFAIGLILYFNIDWLFDKTMSGEDLSQARTMILLLLFNLTFTFPLSIFGAIITAHERFIFQKSLVIARIILSTVVLIIVLSFGYKAVALVIVQTVFNLSLLICNLIYCTTRLHVHFRFNRFRISFLKELFTFSIWVFLSDMMFKFYYNTGQFVLGITSGTIEISLFALGITLMHMYIMFSGGISGVLLPKITSMVALKRSDSEISDLFIRTGRLQYLVMSLILVGFIVLGKPFVKLWAGEDYSPVYYITLIFFVSSIVPLIQNTAISILQARNQQKFRSLMLLIVGAISLIGQFILARFYGALGCAIAVGLANIIGQCFILNWYYKKKQNIDITKFWKEIGKMSIVPCLIGIIGYVIISNLKINNWHSFAIATMAIVAIYLPSVWKGSMNHQERQLVLNPLKKILKRE